LGSQATKIVPDDWILTGVAGSDPMTASRLTAGSPRARSLPPGERELVSDPAAMRLIVGLVV